jgi:predicted ATPase/class 3 adenylate cyclase
MREISEWLDSLGLGQYKSLFAKQNIDFDVLGELTSRDLEQLGISLGHRKKLMRAIARIGTHDRSSPSLPRSPERRHLTVMFCDLVGSTALSSRLDPEDLRSVLVQYQHCISQTIERFGGFIARYMGDGLLVYFGWPKAAEDDAERAVAAGLQAIEIIKSLTQGNELLQVRIGIATGLAIVGDLIGTGVAAEEAVIGEVPNVAAGLQSFAAPSTVVVSSAIRQLVGGQFQMVPLGTITLKGGKRTSAWRVVCEDRSAIRFVPAPPESAVTLFGRDRELRLLQKQWQKVVRGCAQVVLLRGEAGIGKSRTAAAFAERLGDSSHHQLTFQCLPRQVNDSLHPLVRQVEHAAGFMPGDLAQQRLRKLTVLLARSGESSPDTLGLFAALLSIPTDPQTPPLDPDPQRRKSRTLSVLMEQLALLAKQRPVLIQLEDAQWADPTTLELIDLLVKEFGSLPALLIVTARPEFMPIWSEHANVTVCTLDRLSREESGMIISEVAHGKALPRHVFEQIRMKSDGVPLYIEELTKAILESGGLEESDDRWLLRTPTAPLNIPTSIHGSLMARLDRLGWAKELAQLISVLGRDTSQAIIAAVCDLPQERLQEGLVRLIDSQLLYRRAVGETLTYTFKHALVQDAAYGSLLHARRRELHHRIADVFECRFPDIAETKPEMIAHHLTEAQVNQRAITWWHRAGQRNVHASANIEAIAHFDQCLALLAKLPEGQERDAIEIDVRIDLGVSLMGTVGYTAPEFQANTERALEVCERLDETPRLYPILWSQVAQTFSSGDVKNALPMAERFLRSAERRGDRQLQMIGHRLFGMTLYGHGDLQLARQHLEEALDLYNEDADSTLAYRYGADQKVATLAYLGRTLHQLGCPDQGMRMAQHATRAAAALEHVNTTIYARGCLLELRLIRREFAQVANEATLLAELAHGHTVQNYQLVSRAVHHIVDLVNNRAAHLALAIERSIRELSKLNWNYWVVRLSLVGAEACVEAGHAAQGRDLLEGAASMVNRLEQGICVPDLHRVRAAVLYAENGPADAIEASLRCAIYAARERSARYQELRSTVGLAGFLCATGRRVEAAHALAPWRSGLDEGLDLVDVKAAKEMVDMLHISS